MATTTRNLRAARLPIPAIRRVPLPAAATGSQVTDAVRLNTAMLVAAELLEKLRTDVAIDSEGKVVPGSESFYAFATGSLESALGHLLAAVQTRLDAEAALIEAAAPVARSLTARIDADNCMTQQAVMVRQLNDALQPFGGAL
ncbi:MAG TPA: hypothetical protein VFE72_04270 [Lysobacter sp.]|nr:hypothetical protein [Lysobacter sp.]